MTIVGIIGAMHEEVAHLIAGMSAQSGYLRRQVGMRDYHVGRFASQPCVVVLARIGKVAAAVTAVTLIREFGVTDIIFTGLAGGLATCGRVGDIVLATRLVQHDLDARPLFPQYEVPLLGRAEFAVDSSLHGELAQAAQAFFTHDFPSALPAATCAAFGIEAPSVHSGLILSGDQFIGDPGEAVRLTTAFPEALAVEMEGAAVAQVCHEYERPFAVLRTISDRADANAHVDFGKFLASVASVYSDGILRQFFLARQDRG